MHVYACINAEKGRAVTTQPAAIMEHKSTKPRHMHALCPARLHLRACMSTTYLILDTMLEYDLASSERPPA